jgi:hypothetical protein
MMTARAFCEKASRALGGEVTADYIEIGVSGVFSGTQKAASGKGNGRKYRVWADDDKIYGSIDGKNTTELRL